MAARIRIGVLGAGGRMGAAVIAAAAAEPRAMLAGAIERAGHEAVGRPLGAPFAANLTICANPGPLAHASDVLIDFTSPAALEATLDAACEAGKAVVVGTTGLEAGHHALIDRAARTVAVLQAANTSLGVAVLTRLVREAARTLDWDIEIAELHHRHKVDAPSGTALALGEAAAAARGRRFDDVAAYGREGERRPGEIGFASLRGGSAAGDHLVLLAGEGERIELVHRAENRMIFARGALQAALWLAGKAAGRYAIDDVLGL
ncbi:4-hydroxy-tetrahydrodipicolinate reductase [alpha proteobacterium AAP81b]|nr:4-hydroxy-tetrahydrodipicolinate reductase [alpha proteobacterium AAP81b]